MLKVKLKLAQSHVELEPKVIMKLAQNHFEIGPSRPEDGPDVRSVQQALWPGDASTHLYVQRGVLQSCQRVAIPSFSLP